MAGIGFELRKVAALGTVRGFFQASLSGIMIVAGPWLITIATILMFQHPVMGVPASFRELFTASTVYIYAGSLILTGGFHYIFTRILSDYLYRNQNARAFGFTLRYILRSSYILLPAALLFVRYLMPGNAAPLIHKAGFVTLFFFINHIWILMLTASAIRRFNQLLLTFVAGMGCSLLFMKLSMIYLDQSALLLAYALGQGILFTVLMIILYREMGWERPAGRGEYLRYMLRYRSLFITGFVYYAALWGDKVVYWFLRGEATGASRMYLYPDFDLVVYLTNLMMIPGLVFFVIYSETEFFMVLKKTLDSLSRRTVMEIRTQKYALIAASRRILKEQICLQLTIALAFTTFVVAHPFLSERLTLFIPSILAITVLGLYLCLINFMFYVERYLQVLICTLLFLILCVALPLIPGLGERLVPGSSSLIGISAATLLAFLFFLHTLKNLPRIIFSSMNRNRLREIREEHMKRY